MKVYHYDEQTRIYAGESFADKDQLVQGEFLMPALATSVPPPVFGDHQTAVFDGERWTVVPCFLGVQYWLPDGSYYVISEVGVVPPSDAQYIPPAVSPTVVTMRQARLALARAGMLDAVNAAIDGLDDIAAKISWEYATEVRRRDVYLERVRTKLALSDGQVDELFLLAGTF